MTAHDEIRNSPEYLEWMERELLKKITHNRKMREVVAGAIAAIADILVWGDEQMDQDLYEGAKEAISKLQSAMEAEK